MNYLELVQVVEGRPDVDPQTWATEHRTEVEQALSTRGAILLRGFREGGPSLVENVLRVFSKELLEDAFWSTPRSGVSGKTFTATEYPGPRTISLHSEMAYMTTFPRLLAFHSIKVAEEGGQTTVADLDAVSRDLVDILDQFAGGVMYQRYYHPGVDIPWQQAFRTEDKAELGRTAKRVHMDIAWLDGGSLRTRHTAQGTARAEDGRPLFFNQAHLFHASNLSAKDRATLSSLFGDDCLPRNAYFASGEAISDELVAHVHSVLEKNTVNVEWRPGDVLIIDNMRFLHGRRPYAGTRKLHVALAIAQDTPTRGPIFSKKAGLFGRLFG